MKLSKKVAYWLGLAGDVLDVMVHDGHVVVRGVELQLVVRVGRGCRGVVLRGRVGGD